MKNTQLENIICVLASWAEKTSGVEALWIYGSAAKGELRNDSDADIAILFAYGSLPTPDQRLILTDHLSSLVGRDADILLMNAAGEVIQEQVLRYGIRVFARNDTRTSLFELGIRSKYRDFLILRQPLIEAEMERVNG